MADRGLCIAGRVGATVDGIPFEDEWGRVVIYPLPYAEPAVVRDALASDFADHDAALGALLDRVRAGHPAGDRSVVVAHAFVAGSAVSDSERPLSVGGSGAIMASRFHGFDYVALGHLHRPQRAGADNAHYAGSLLKYSLSEADHEKSVSLVELGAPGKFAIERIALRPRRDLRRIGGELVTLVAAGQSDPGREDYVFASLTDSGALLDPMNRLREVYPNVLGCERTVLANVGAGVVNRTSHRALDTRALFGDFFREVTGEAFDDEAGLALDATLESLARGERGAS